MWDRIKSKFDKYPSRMEVAKEFLRLGISVRDGKAWCGNIELTPSKIARTLGVDRKVVLSTIQIIERDEVLKKVYSLIKPIAYIGDVAQLFDFGVLEIYAESEKSGIVGSIAGILGKEGISIRFIIAEDPELSIDPKLTIVTEKRVPGRIIDQLLKVNGVKKIVVS
jgi:hypothetical protein